MDTKLIQLRELKLDVEGYLQNCSQSGQPLLVELPDKRLLAIQPVEQDDDLVNELIANNPAFRAMLARSATSPMKPFQPAVAQPSAQGIAK